MLNSTSGETGKDALSECMIELERKEPTYSPGDHLKGKLNIKLNGGSLVITALRLTLQGISKISIRGKKDESCQESCVYLKKEWTLVESTTTITSQETSFNFEETLPESLPTSVFSPKGHVQYTLISTLEYMNNDQEVCLVKAVRGITVVEELDLNKLPRPHFEPRNDVEQRKFGWFSCTGGQIKLVLSFERTAFVCGEGVVITGRIENKSDRHVDKVCATLQKKCRYGADLDNANEPSFFECQDVQEDMLAMYVVQGSNIKIDKKIGVPPAAPSTPIIAHAFKSSSKEDVSLFQIRRKSALGGRMSVTSLKSGSSVAAPFRRLVEISYSYVVRVKSGGADIIEINIPVIIGTIPLRSTEPEFDPVTSGSIFPGALFKQCRVDKPNPLLDDKVRTVCNKAQLTHINKYPFYPDLISSSKQSKKLCVVASNVRAETRIVQMIKGNPDTTLDNDNLRSNITPEFSFQQDESQQYDVVSTHSRSARSTSPRRLNVESLLAL